MKKAPRMATLFLLLVLAVLFAAVPALANGAGARHIAKGYDFVAAVMHDGTVKVAGDDVSGLESISAWRDVVALEAGDGFVLGLKKDGTVYAAGDNTYGACNVADWKDIVMVAADYSAGFGLNRDGTVQYTGVGFSWDGEEIAAWKDIVWIDVCDGYVYAIDRDGKGYAAGLDDIDIRDAAQIDAAFDEMYVLKKDGSLARDGYIGDLPEFSDPDPVDDLGPVIDIDLSGPWPVGLMKDGDIVDDRDASFYDRWNHIAEIRDGYGITAEGNVVFPENCVFPDQAYEEICSWKVMVDENRAAELSVDIKVKDAEQVPDVLTTTGGLRLRGQAIPFPDDFTYEVYSGPGESYLRGGNGKALVSTGGEIHVYGVENGWALIRYDISGSRQRYGYIPAITLPHMYADSKRIKLVNFEALAEDAVILRNTYITDDPHGSKEQLCKVQAGTVGILYLGTLNEDWAYVQFVNGEGVPLRGFMPTHDVQAKKKEGLITVMVPEWADSVWTNASPVHYFYGTQEDYFVVPDNVQAVYLPAALASMEKFHDLWMLKNLRVMVVPPNHPHYKSVDGVLYDKDVTLLLFYPAGREDGEYAFPAGTVSVNYDCGFESAKNLVSVVLPTSFRDQEMISTLPNLQRYVVREGNQTFKAMDGVLFTLDGTVLVSYPAARPGDTYRVPDGTKMIGMSAFPQKCLVKHVVLPEGLEIIEMGAFSDCLALESVVFPNTLTDIEEGAFGGCENLTGVTLPVSLRYIGHMAFAWSGLTGELHIPEGVDFINTMAFWSTTVSDLYLPASLTQWELDTSYGWEDGSSGPTVHAPRGSWAAEYARENGFEVVEEP